MVIGGGFVLISAARRVLYDARRPPQYVGFILVMFGFLLQWPTLLFPVLVVMYVRLARAEECEALTAFGPLYATYMRDVPAFVLHWWSLSGQALR